MKRTKKLKPLSLYPLKTEEALSLFMRVDPAKVEAGIRKLYHKKARVRKACLSV